MQAEALAHFQRMTTPPAAAFRSAFNQAVYEWKAQGSWALLKGFWFLAADTQQAALLSVIGDTPRNAVTVGAAPTFTPGKGFTGFDVGKRLRFPITAALIGVTDYFSGTFVSGRFDYDATSDVIVGDTGGLGVGNVRSTTRPGGAERVLELAGAFARPERVGPATIMGKGVGGQGNCIITGGGVQADGASYNDPTNNYTTAAIATGDHPLKQLVAYGIISSAATTAQCRKFMATLDTLINRIGAFD